MLGLSGCAASASAQQYDELDGFHEYARNKIGLLRYCRDQALIGQVTAERAIKAIEAALRHFPVSDALVKKRGERAEKLGETGFWEANGKNARADLASVASRTGASTADLCKELAGQTKSNQKPVVAKQISPDVTKTQANLYAKSATAAVKPVRAPTAPKKPKPPVAGLKPAAATVTPPVTARRAPSTKLRTLWRSSPFDVNRWRLNRQERPWVP
jgi:hypothetical protein